MPESGTLILLHLQHKSNTILLLLNANNKGLLFIWLTIGGPLHDYSNKKMHPK